MRVHELKTWPPQFAAVERMEKTFEVRRNDRDFQVGDFLKLREWDPIATTYSGAEIAAEVTYVLRG